MTPLEWVEFSGGLEEIGLELQRALEVESSDVEHLVERDLAFLGAVELRHRIHLADASLDFFQALFQLIDVGCEILIKVVLVVEVDDTHFIVRVGSSYQIQRRRVHLFTLLAHRSGIVDHDAHGDRNILVPE